MLGQNFFHHAIIRKLTAVFGTLFNNLDIKRYNEQGNEQGTIRVPLQYAPKQRWYQLVFGDNNQNDGGKFSVRVPSMGFELTSLLYDTTRKVNQIHKISSGNLLNNSLLIGRTGVPYTLEFSLYVFANKTADWTQIIEQIIPFFNPTFNVPVKMVTNTQAGESIVQDIHITLNGVTPDANVYGDFRTRSTYTWNLSFSMTASMFGNFEEPEGGVIAGSSVQGGTDPAILVRFWDDQNGSMTIGDDQVPLMTIEHP